MRGATSVSPENIFFCRDSWASTADFLENGELCCCNPLCEGRGGGVKMEGGSETNGGS